MKRLRPFVRLVLFLPLAAILWLSADHSAFAGYELPPGERITNLPHIPRSMPQKEAYEIYDPVIGRNFDLKNFWMRADLRIRPEWRNASCFGGSAPVGGACNSTAARGALSGATFGQANAGKSASDFYVQQWVRLGLGYDLSPDVNFYFEIIDSAEWGANGNPLDAGNGGDPLNHSCGQGGAPTGLATNCRLGVRAAYALIRNLVGIQGLSMKVGRQYVVFGNHSLFGHFDWANTGYSHDGIMFNYNANKNFESWLGWFRNSETDLGQAAPVGSLAPNVVGAGTGRPDGSGDADLFMFYNQVKSIPGMLVEPYYVLYSNNLHESANSGQGVGTPKHSAQIRHMIGQRSEVRNGNWDGVLETAWQFGRMADGLGTDNSRNLTINAWALRSWLGYTIYQNKWKPRFAVGFDYASGDGNANCGGPAGTSPTCKTANTFENFFPTNYLHAGYMLNHAWKNQVQPQVNVQAKPTMQDHLEFWGQLHYLANARDNWYRGAQGVLVYSRPNNTANYLGSETDFAWTHMFANGKVSFTATYGHFFAGEYIRQNLGTNSDQDWGIVQLWMNF
jgi:hypothetical protein